jgi:CubicO group peptidase (beta-lactamase class C family)
MRVTRRPAVESDWELFRRCHHAAYREAAERQFGPWDEARQDRFAASNWREASFEILLCDGQPCGYTCVEELGDHLHVREIVVHPDFQNRGVGSTVLHGTIDRARARGVPIRLGTFVVNRAADLYRRLGFQETGRTATHILFEWREAAVDIRANAHVNELLRQLVDDGRELGLQVAAYLNGRLVVDTWAGLADRAAGRPIEGDTLFTVFSTGKGVAATCAHLLAERGQLDYDAPVARYWPEFAANGKEAVTVRDALTHRAGIPQMPEGLVPEDLLDWEKMVAAVAQLRPMLPPGTTTAYHALTFGWIVGALVRRIDGRPIGRFVQEEICVPLGMSDLYFGIPEAAAPRVARLERAEPESGVPVPAPDSIAALAAPRHLVDIIAQPPGWRASIPGGNMVASARAVARMYAGLVGEVDGVRLLPPERIRVATELQTGEVDANLGRPINKGLGYFLGGSQPSAIGSRLTAFGHPGAGGSIGFGDPEIGLAVGFAKTLLTTHADPSRATTLLVADRVRAALGLG